MRTPLAQLIERLDAVYEANPMHQEYREGLAEAISNARSLLPIEQAHMKAAWRDGADGILHQTAEGYFRSVYITEKTV